MSASVFDNLVQGMSRGERQDLLEKIQSVSVLESEPIADFLEDPSQIDIQAEYRKMSLIQRFIIFLKRIFSGKDFTVLVEQYLLERMGKRIESNFPGFIDAHRNILKEPLAQRVDDLRNSVSWLAGPLGNALGDSRRQMITFMFSVLNPALYDVIGEKTDPEYVARQNPELNDRELKKMLVKNLQETLETISTDQRQVLYMNYRFLYHLLQLASFPYTKILNDFRGPEDRWIPTSFNKVEGGLRRLDSQINSITEIPTADILQQVFVFLEQEYGDAEERSENVVKQLKKAADSVAKLRSFAREVPLRDTIAFFTGDLRYLPLALSGGEDWFAIFREHITRVVEQRVDVYVFARRKREIISDMIKLAGVSSFPPASPYAASSGNHGGKYQFSLTLCQFVSTRLFIMRWVSPLKILMIDGDFYKDHNREEYNESFGKLENADERIKTFLNDLPEDLFNGASESALRIEVADQSARQMIEDVYSGLRIMSDVLDGILFGEVGGRFDTISNLGQIGGRSNKKFLAQLETVLEEIQMARDNLKESFELESGRKL